jgi:hypothetical protein
LPRTGRTKIECAVIMRKKSGLGRFFINLNSQSN